MSDIPGTTRDTVEETLTIESLTFRFIDTAGLRDSNDTVEALGIERSRKAIADADIVLYVHDLTQPFSNDDVAALNIGDKHLILVGNKCDLVAAVPEGFVAISAKKGVGIEVLKKAMLDVVETQAMQALAQVAEGLEAGIPADLLAVDLRDALHHLGSITGEVVTDDILGNIFSRFCIGK